MTVDNSSPLREKDEILLSRYFDGECCFVSRFFAQQLLKRNRHAQHFYSRLESLRRLCSQKSAEIAPSVQCDLWDRIERRITTEERLARYDGDASRQSFAIAIRSLFCPQTAIGAVSGACVAVIFLTVAPQGGRSTGPSQAKLSGVEFARATVPNERSSKPRSAIVPNILPEQESEGMHELVAWNEATGAYGSAPSPRGGGSARVDWLRANGPLALLENPGGSSSIIWVKRRPGRSALGIVDAAPVQPTAYSRPGAEGLLPSFNELK